MASIEMFSVPARSATYSPVAANRSGAVVFAIPVRMIVRSTTLIALPPACQGPAPSRRRLQHEGARGAQPTGPLPALEVDRREDGRPDEQALEHLREVEGDAGGQQEAPAGPDHAEEEGHRQQCPRLVAHDEGAQQAVVAEVVVEARLDPVDAAGQQDAAGEPCEGAPEDQGARRDEADAH